MTYTTSNDTYAFFVVGGNSAGTETGRVYAVKGPYTNNWYLLNPAVSADNLTQWDRSYWTGQTIIYTTTASTYNWQPASYGRPDKSLVNGSILFDKVTIL